MSIYKYLEDRGVEGSVVPARNIGEDKVSRVQEGVFPGVEQEKPEGPVLGRGLQPHAVARNSGETRTELESGPVESRNRNEEVTGEPQVQRPSRFDDCPGEGTTVGGVSGLDINQYANWTEGFWFSGKGRPEKESVAIMAMGLAGEAGEVVEHLKKFVRDDHINVTELKKELGDSIYYWSRICKQFGLEPTEVLQANVEKLVSRRERGKLRGDGDNR